MGCVSNREAGEPGISKAGSVTPGTHTPDTPKTESMDKTNNNMDKDIDNNNDMPDLPDAPGEALAMVIQDQELNNKTTNVTIDELTSGVVDSNINNDNSNNNNNNNNNNENDILDGSDNDDSDDMYAPINDNKHSTPGGHDTPGDASDHKNKHRTNIDNGLQLESSDHNHVNNNNENNNIVNSNDGIKPAGEASPQNNNSNNNNNNSESNTFHQASNTVINHGSRSDSLVAMGITDNGINNINGNRFETSSYNSYHNNNMYTNGNSHHSHQQMEGQNTMSNNIANPAFNHPTQLPMSNGHSSHDSRHNSIIVRRESVANMGLVESIGFIRKCIIRGKREIRNKRKNEREFHENNVKLLLKLINKDISILTQNDESIILQIYQTMKEINNDKQLGKELLDVLETLDLKD